MLSPIRERHQRLVGLLRRGRVVCHVGITTRSTAPRSRTYEAAVGLFAPGQPAARQTGRPAASSPAPEAAACGSATDTARDAARRHLAPRRVFGSLSSPKPTQRS
jgi:hypothetical protein